MRDSLDLGIEPLEALEAPLTAEQLAVFYCTVAGAVVIIAVAT